MECWTSDLVKNTFPLANVFLWTWELNMKINISAMFLTRSTWSTCYQHWSHDRSVKGLCVVCGISPEMPCVQNAMGIHCKKYQKINFLSTFQLCLHVHVVKWMQFWLHLRHRIEDRFLHLWSTWIMHDNIKCGFNTEMMSIEILIYDWNKPC